MLLIASVLAVGGDGSSDGIEKVLTFGAAWILAASILSMILAVKGKGTASILVAVMTLPSAYLAGLAGILTGAVASQMRPSSPAFVELCKSAGATYVSKPASPVHSIVYEWEGRYPPTYSYFKVNPQGNVLELAAGSLYREPAGLAFTETQNDSGPSDGSRRYVRRTGGDSAWSPDPTADLLIKYQSTPVHRAGLEPGMVQYDIAVSDRRDGRQLASFRYFLNDRERRGCGTTSDGVMSEVELVSRAIGLPPTRKRDGASND
ncbi:MAG TPA: hypothetical protein VM687_12480 [Stenotrophomonas sp.]|nr:hypothetical protein [Stenotrophomonas sp.]